MFSAFSKKLENVYRAFENAENFVRVFENAENFVRVFEFGTGEIRKVGRGKLEKNFRTFRVFRAVHVFALACFYKVVW